MKRPTTIFHRIMFFVLIVFGISAVGYAAINITPRNRSTTSIIQVTPLTIQPSRPTTTVTPIPVPTPEPIPAPATPEITPVPTPEPRPSTEPIPAPATPEITPVINPIPRPIPTDPVFTGVIVTGVITIPEFTDIQKNIFKYRNYRERLKQRFVYVTNNNEHGSNILASKTKAYAWRSSDIIDFWDSVSTMGFYLGMLATEYRLLKNEGKDTTQTLKELMYALKAFDRLDYYAESYYGGTNSTNGFFIRDDVPNYSYPVCNPGIGNPDNPFAYHFWSDIKKIGYNYGSCDIRDNEMSQDQFRGMMLGLSLIKKLVTEGTVTLDGEQYNFQNKTKEITSRVVHYMHITERKRINKRVTIAIRRWRIKNPVTGELVKRGPMGWPDVMAWYAYGFARAGRWIANEDLDRKNTVDPEREISKLLFTQLGNGNIATISNTLSQIGIPMHTYNLYGGRLLGTIANFRGSDTVDVTFNNDFYFMGLLHYVLHGNSGTKAKLDNKMSFFQNQLNTAPAEWPYNFGGSDRPASNDRTSQNLLRNPEDRGTIPTNDPNQMRQRVGEYHGVDYLLLHNLFLLTYKNNIEPFTFGK